MHIIGGKFKKKSILAPKNKEVRPTTSQLRESLFNICQFDIEGARFLDLFAGSGAIGLEALSRGAKSATFVENNRLALAVIKKNISSLKVEEQTRLFSINVFKALQQFHDQREKFELIYVDPPYGMGLSASVLDFVDAHSILVNNGSLFIEDAVLYEPCLKYLKLHGQRKVGRAHLYEFRITTRII